MARMSCQESTFCSGLHLTVCYTLLFYQKSVDCLFYRGLPPANNFLTANSGSSPYVPDTRLHVHDGSVRVKFTLQKQGCVDLTASCYFQHLLDLVVLWQGTEMCTVIFAPPPLQRSYPSPVEEEMDSKRIFLLAGNLPSCLPFCIALYQQTRFLGNKKKKKKDYISGFTYAKTRRKSGRKTQLEVSGHSKIRKLKNVHTDCGVIQWPAPGLAHVHVFVHSSAAEQDCSFAKNL